MRDNYRHRSLYIRLFVVIGALILIGQLINLQIIKDYGEQADDNAFLRKTIYAMRGLIYDRNGKLLVFNQPIYDIDIIVKQWDDLKKQDTPVDTTELCRVLGIEKSDFIERLDNLKDTHTATKTYHTAHTRRSCCNTGGYMEVSRHIARQPYYEAIHHSLRFSRHRIHW